jgi:hypothetical protein
MSIPLLTFFTLPTPMWVFPTFPHAASRSLRCVAAVPSPFFLGSSPHVSHSSVWRAASAVVEMWTVPRATRASAAVAGLVALAVRLASTVAAVCVKARRVATRQRVHTILCHKRAPGRLAVHRVTKAESHGRRPSLILLRGLCQIRER